MNVRHSIWDAFLDASKVVLRVAMWAGIAYAGFLGIQALTAGALAGVFGATGATAATAQLGWVGQAAAAVVNGIGSGLATAVGTSFTTLSGAQAIGAVLATAMTPAVLKGTEGIREAVSETLTGVLRTDGAIASEARSANAGRRASASPQTTPSDPERAPQPNAPIASRFVHEHTHRWEPSHAAPFGTVHADSARYDGRMEDPLQQGRGAPA